MHIGIRIQCIEELRLLYDNSPDDIFNVYRTRLFFKWVPDKTFTSKGEQSLGGILSYNPFKWQYVEHGKISFAFDWEITSITLKSITLSSREQQKFLDKV